MSVAACGHNSRDIVKECIRSGPGLSTMQDFSSILNSGRPQLAFFICSKKTAQTCKQQGFAILEAQKDMIKKPQSPVTTGYRVLPSCHILTRFFKVL